MTLTERIQQLKEKHGSIRAAARALKVDHAALMALNLPRLQEEAKRYYMQGAGTRRLTVERAER